MALDHARADAGKPHLATRPYPRDLACRTGLASPVERLTIEAATMTSELDLQPSAGFALDASDTILHGVTVSSDAGWRMTLPEGRLTMIRQDGQAPSTT
jgi:hypothetical protein